jgi:hypothetical protein
MAQERDSAGGEVETEHGFLRLVETAPIREIGTVTGRAPPRRVANTKRRDREHLTEQEIEALYQAAEGSRHGQRDALMIWMPIMMALAYRGQGRTSAQPCSLPASVCSASASKSLAHSRSCSLTSCLTAVRSRWRHRCAFTRKSCG